MKRDDLKMVVVGIKPLSVNEAWKGRRFKTDSYKKYERDMFLMLPNVVIPAGELKISYEFGVSNMQSDVDNPVKPLQDILQKKYKFNDSRVVEISAIKRKVKKGFEYAAFKIVQASGES